MPSGPLSGARIPAQRTPNPLSGAVDRERKVLRDSAAGRGRQSLVSTRLADDRQQNPVEHRRGDLRFLVHIRPAGRCPGVLPATAPEEGGGAAAERDNGEFHRKTNSRDLGTRVRQSLPPLDELIESGKVLALNMPAGSNPALARAVGVMLKNAWLQSLLRRPSQMKAAPDQYFRPAVFICDEYQSFASVGEDDPSGDEKSFALTRQCRCRPDRRHPDQSPRCGRCSAAQKPGAPCFKRSAPGYSFP